MNEEGCCECKKIRDFLLKRIDEIKPKREMIRVAIEEKKTLEELFEYLSSLIYALQAMRILPCEH